MNHRPNYQANGMQEGKRAFGKDITNICKGINPIDQLKKIEKHSEQIKNHEQNLKKSQKLDAIHDYHEDIFAFMSAYSQRKLKMMTQDTEISDSMRQTLIDWLVDVHQSFELKEETLFLAWKYLDQYQSYNSISKKEYQLVGITCLWIASKYEEIYPPRMKKFVDITANTYTHHQLKYMESRVLQFLQFDLNRVTPISFLNTLLLQQFDNKGIERSLSLAKEIIELSYMNGNIIKKYDTKTIVIASIKLAEAICKKQINIGYFICQLNSSGFYECYKEMSLLLQVENKQRHTAIKRKYQKEKYHFVGKIIIKTED